MQYIAEEARALLALLAEVVDLDLLARHLKLHRQEAHQRREEL